MLRGATVTNSDERQLNRRDMLKRGALVGGALIWTTPIVQSIGGSALATTGTGDCGWMTGGGQLTGTYRGEPARVTFGLGKIRCGSTETTLEVNAHPINSNGPSGDASFHFTTIITLNCITTGDPSPPKNSEPNRYIGTASDGNGHVVSFDFTDNGEPGTNDEATISISENSVVILTATGFTGGNLQAHKSNC